MIGKPTGLVNNNDCLSQLGSPQSTQTTRTIKSTTTTTTGTSYVASSEGLSSALSIPQMSDTPTTPSKNKIEISSKGSNNCGVRPNTGNFNKHLSVVIASFKVHNVFRNIYKERLTIDSNLSTWCDGSETPLNSIIMRDTIRSVHMQNAHMKKDGDDAELVINYINQEKLTAGENAWNTYMKKQLKVYKVTKPSSIFWDYYDRNENEFSDTFNGRVLKRLLSITKHSRLVLPFSSNVVKVLYEHEHIDEYEVTVINGN